MLITLLFILALFVAIWQTIIFVGCALNKTLDTYTPFSIIVYAVSLTAVMTHLMKIW